MYSKIQYISQGKGADEQFENICKALDAGCTWVQLRYKNSTLDENRKLAERVRQVCDTYYATFIVNDHVDIAIETDADGVHLGQKDMPVSKARKILGSNKIIGGTANTANEVVKCIKESCNYIGLGPFRYTKTKENLSPVLGDRGISKILHETGNNSLLDHVQIPIYAVGGIEITDVVKIMGAGVYGLAISGAISYHPNPKELLEIFNILIHESTDRG